MAATPTNDSIPDADPHALTNADTAAARPSVNPARIVLQLLIGVVLGAVASAIASFAIAYLMLMTPAAGYFGFTQGTTGLTLAGIAASGGMLGACSGLCFGILWNWRHAWLVGMLCTFLPIAWFGLQDISQEDPMTSQSTLVLRAIGAGLCMLASTAIALLLLDWVFEKIKSKSDSIRPPA